MDLYKKEEIVSLLSLETVECLADPRVRSSSSDLMREPPR